MSKPAVELAREAYWRADAAVREVEDRQRAFLQEARVRAEREATGRFRVELDVARMERGRVQELRWQAEEQAAIHEPREVPVGTRMEEWARKKYGDNEEPTGRKGILEIITAESVHPGNKSNVDRGRVVIRLLKKDGKPSRDYVAGDWEMKNRWRAEGRTE